MSQHAILSPSKASRWINCPGSIALCADIPDTTSSYAEEGTAAHAVAAARLLNIPGPAAADVETSDYINVYTNAVRNAAEGKTLMVEQAVNLERWTAEKGGKGTADAIVVDLEAESIEVWDLKFGAGHIVDAEQNEQLMLYGLGALDVVEMCYGPVKTVKLVICQPRRDHISTWAVTRDELTAFGEVAHAAGVTALEILNESNNSIKGDDLKPSPKACLWCPAKVTCSALAATVTATVFEEFAVCEQGKTAPTTLKPVVAGNIPNADTLELISQWVSSVYAFVDERLKAGDALTGWKLVIGKKGNRKWADEGKVEMLLKKLRFKKAQTHEEKLLPLTKIEKLVPKEKWPLFEAVITQADGQPTAAPESDKRPAYKPSSEVFDAFI